MSSNISRSTNAYDLSTYSRPGHLHVSISSGSPHFEMSRPLWSEIAIDCSQDKCDKVLIETDIPQPLSIADLHSLRSVLAENGISGCRIVVVDPRRERHEINRFAKIVLAREDITLMAFTALEDAEQWLEIDKPPAD